MATDGAVRTLLEDLEQERLSLLRRRASALKDLAALDLLRFDQLVDDCAAYVARGDSEAARLGATAHPVVVSFLSADAMLLRSLRTAQEALAAPTPDDFARLIREANGQEALAREAMASTVFDVLRLRD